MGHAGKVSSAVLRADGTTLTLADGTGRAVAVDAARGRLVVDLRV
jgi:hypothetical protein